VLLTNGSAADRGVLPSSWRIVPSLELAHLERSNSDALTGWVNVDFAE